MKYKDNNFSRRDTEKRETCCSLGKFPKRKQSVEQRQKDCRNFKINKDERYKESL